MEKAYRFKRQYLQIHLGRLHSITHQWPRMAPCPKADSLWEFVLSPAMATFNTVGFNFSSMTPVPIRTTSVHAPLFSWGTSVATASLYMRFSGDEGFTGHVRSPVLAWP